MGLVENKIGLRVADLRKLARLTQAKLAEKVGVTTETISRLERGAAIPSLARMEDIAGALGADLPDLFRLRDRPSARDRAVDRLLTVVRRRPAADIELVADLAARVFSRRCRHTQPTANSPRPRPIPSRGRAAIPARGAVDRPTSPAGAGRIAVAAGRVAVVSAANEARTAGAGWPEAHADPIAWQGGHRCAPAVAAMRW